MSQQEEQSAEQDQNPLEAEQDQQRVERLHQADVPAGADVAFPEGRYPGAPPESGAIFAPAAPEASPQTQEELAEMGRTGHTPAEAGPAEEPAAEQQQAAHERAEEDRERNLGGGE